MSPVVVNVLVVAVLRISVSPSISPYQSVCPASGALPVREPVWRLSPSPLRSGLGLGLASTSGDRLHALPHPCTSPSVAEQRTRRSHTPTVCCKFAEQVRSGAALQLVPISTTAHATTSPREPYPTTATSHLDKPHAQATATTWMAARPSRRRLRALKMPRMAREEAEALAGRQAAVGPDRMCVS
jgi:hypothetical protein